MESTLFDTVLSKLTLVGKPDSQGNYTAFCPFHLDQKHPNLRVRRDKGFKCFACGTHGSINKLAQYLGIETGNSPETPMSNSVNTIAEAMELLRKRGLRDNTITHFQLSVDLGKQAWKFPVIYQGEAKAYRYKAFPGRAGAKNWWAKRATTFSTYGLDSVKDKPEVCLVEGEPDCWVMYQVNLPAITFTGGAGVIPQGAIQSLKAAGIKKLNLIYDDDKAGREGSRKVAQTLRDEGFNVLVKALPQLQEGHKDINDLYHELGGDDNKLREAIAGLKEVSTESDFTILHPALEVRPDLALVGFQEKVVDREDIVSNNIFLVATSDGIKLIRSSIFDLGKGKAIIEAKGKILPLASEVVGISGLQAWIREPQRSGAAGIYNQIETVLRRYIFLPETAYKLVSAWVMGSYFYPAFGAYPFLHFLGPKETGKSNTLFVLSKLCFNSIRSSYLTAPALADTTDALRGTLLLDQAEHWDKREDLLNILADSYKREGGIRRVVTLTKAGRKTDVFNSYSPKAFASTDNLPEDLADRCFTIHMSPARASYPDPSASGEDWKAIRTELYKLLLTSYKQVHALASQGTNEKSRFAELWQPIQVMLALTEVEAGEVEKVRAYCAEKFSQVRYELDDWDEAVVRAVLDSPDEIAASQLLEKVISNISPGEGDPKPGARWLGKALRRLGLCKRQSRQMVEGKRERLYILDKDEAKRKETFIAFSVVSPGGSGQTGKRANRYENTVPSGGLAQVETGKGIKTGQNDYAQLGVSWPVCPSGPFLPGIPPKNQPNFHVSNKSQNASPLVAKTGGPEPDVVGQAGRGPDRREGTLGMPVAKALWIWRSKGAPVIHLGPGENCFDLEELLSDPNVLERHLVAIRAWLDKVRGEYESFDN